MKKRYTVLLLLIALAAATVAGAAQQLSEDDQRSLRTRIEDRYDVVMLSDGIGLRPKTRTGDLRLIEITDTIAINGEPVTGRELRERIGADADADAIIKLSYLDVKTRQALFGPETSARSQRGHEANVEAERHAREMEEAARREAQRAEAERVESERSPRRRVSRDTVRILGDITVAENEEINGQAVAVIGSIRVDGHVRQEVVAVLGSVTLGPNAVVGGDVVSVGGRIRRSPGAEIRGSVTEISIADHRLNVSPWLGVGIPFFFDGFNAVSRLFGSLFRLVLLALLASMAFVLARRTVEASAQRIRENPIQAVLVGLAAGILFVPVIFLTCFVLALSIIGIPLLLLVPFALLFLVLLAFAGFSGSAYAVGQWARRRFGSAAPVPVLDVCVGVAVLLLPVLAARVISLALWPMNPLAWVLLAAGVGVEFLAWSGGFGAVLTNAFSRWQSTRAARVAPAPPATM